ncbi:MAG: AAA family ATPase [Deltaproteobacteria bacterium]|nr:AAA family ATPase [Deltaproteobacteria bacterium]
MISVAFFNNKGGVGKTTLAYHLAWMLRTLGLKVLAADLDPQANLSTMCLDEERVLELTPEAGIPRTILGCVQPILDGTGDVAPAYIEAVSEGFGLIVGDLGLTAFEDKLSDAWPRCHDGDESAFRTTTAFARILREAGEREGAQVSLIDVGPNLGAINRAALVAADFVLIPLVPDLFSLRALTNLGPALRRWREDWRRRLDSDRAPRQKLALPTGAMEPVGYVVSQHAVRQDRATRAFDVWMARIPRHYQKTIMMSDVAAETTLDQDHACLASLRHYRSLMAMAMEARKPIFDLKPADGAIGAHVEAVRRARGEFRALAEELARRVGLRP